MTKMLPKTAVSWTLLSIIAHGAAGQGGKSLPSPVTVGRAGATPLFQAINDELDLRSSVVQTLPFAQQRESDLTTAVIVDGNTWTLALQKNSIRSPDFKVWAQGPSGALTPVEPPAARTYKGTVLELPGSEVRASFYDGELEAVIYTLDHGIVGIQPLAKAGFAVPKAQHAIYHDSDWINKHGYACGTEGAQFDGFADLMVPEGDTPSTAGASVVVAEIALDADYEFFQLNGGTVAATVQDMESIINGVETIYEAQLGITYEITSVTVRSSEPDPYSATNQSALLQQLVSRWNAPPESLIQRDVVHLFTGKDLDGSVIGVAYVGAVCNLSYAYGLSQSRFTASMTHRVALSAHEIGHNWNAQHCNGCTSCSNCCQIMCSSLGGCSGILTSFGCQEVSQISAFRDSRTCLSDAVNCTTNADCDDGLYCNGAEACVAGSCEAGSAPNCNDGIACTVDSCNEATGQCDHVPNNSLCNDGLFCNGNETCNATTGCTPGSPPCGAGSCDEAADSCTGGGAAQVWLAFADSTVVPGVGLVENEDIVAYDPDAGTWSLVFDGSDLGLTNLAIDALAVLPSGDILLSFAHAAYVPNMTGGPGGTLLDDSDIVRFVPISLGSTTAGSMVFYFDGSDVDLTNSYEDVDAISLTSDGRLVLSTLGSYLAGGLSGDDKDLIVFNHTSLGSVTAGSFAVYFDGSDVGLSTYYENVDAAGLTSAGTILLSTYGAFSVPAVNGADEDVLRFTPASLGPTTAGTHSMFLDLSALGIAAYENLSALELVE